MAQMNWFITGVTSGFGRYLIEKRVGRGDRVARTGRDREKLNALQNEYGKHVWLTELKLTDAKSCRRAVDDAFYHYSVSTWL